MSIAIALIGRILRLAVVFATRWPRLMSHVIDCCGRYAWSSPSPLAQKAMRSPIRKHEPLMTVMSYSVISASGALVYYILRQQPCILTSIPLAHSSHRGERLPIGPRAQILRATAAVI